MSILSDGRRFLPGAACIRYNDQRLAGDHTGMSGTQGTRPLTGGDHQSPKEGMNVS